MGASCQVLVAIYAGPGHPGRCTGDLDLWPLTPYFRFFTHLSGVLAPDWTAMIQTSPRDGQARYRGTWLVYLWSVPCPLPDFLWFIYHNKNQPKSLLEPVRNLHGFHGVRFKLFQVAQSQTVPGEIPPQEYGTCMKRRPFNLDISE